MALIDFYEKNKLEFNMNKIDYNEILYKVIKLYFNSAEQNIDINSISDFISKYNLNINNTLIIKLFNYSVISDLHYKKFLILADRFSIDIDQLLIDNQKYIKANLNYVSKYNSDANIFKYILDNNLLKINEDLISSLLYKHNIEKLKLLLESDIEINQNIFKKIMLSGNIDIIDMFLSHKKTINIPIDFKEELFKNTLENHSSELFKYMLSHECIFKDEDFTKFDKTILEILNSNISYKQKKVLNMLIDNNIISNKDIYKFFILLSNESVHTFLYFVREFGAEKIINILQENTNKPDFVKNITNILNYISAVTEKSDKVNGKARQGELPLGGKREHSGVEGALAHKNNYGKFFQSAFNLLIKNDNNGMVTVIKYL